MLDQDQKTENKLKGRVFFLCGFLCAFTAYSFHKSLWEYSFYHFTALAFVFYIAESWIIEKSKVWIIIRGFVLITALNSLKDEVMGEGDLYKISEYILFTLIAIISGYRIIKLHYK